MTSPLRFEPVTFRLVKATDLEENPEETEVIAARQLVPNKEAAVEAIGAMDDRYGDRRLPVGRADRRRNGI
jgi:hypothetical protein